MELPKGWIKTNIEEAVIVLDNKRKPINSRERQKRIEGKEESELFPYYGSTGKVGFIDDYLLDGEYVLLGEDGAPFLDTFKKKAYIVSGRIWVNNHAHILKSKTSNKFLNYYLNQFNYKEFVTGTTRLKLNQSSMKKIPIPLPPLPEQHRIVAKIEELFSELDNGIEQLKKAKKQIKTYRQSVLKAAFEGKLTIEWRKKQNNAYDSYYSLSELKKKRIEYAKSQKKIKKANQNFDFNFTRHKTINTWAEATLDNLIYIAGRIGWRGLTKDEYTKEGPLFLSVHSLNYGNYVDFRDAFHISMERYDESPEIKIEIDDILLCKDGAGIGKIGIVKHLPDKTTVNSSLLVIRTMEVFIPEFLFYFLSGPEMQTIVQSRITGSATPHLFQKDIRQFLLSVPPIEEQREIISEIEQCFSVADKLEESIDKSLQQAETLRQSILKKAFEGKLIPQDEEDEPAEKLLERIKTP